MSPRAAYILPALALTLISSLLFALPSSAGVDEGKTVFKTYCTTCHGAAGKGDGPAASGLTPKPANFTDTARFKGKTDAQLAKTIKQGGAATGLSPVMPSWGSVLSDSQISDLVAYVRTLSGTTSPDGGVPTP